MDCVHLPGRGGGGGLPPFILTIARWPKTQQNNKKGPPKIFFCLGILVAVGPQILAQVAEKMPENIF